jgi:hypothetical protein
LSEVKRGLAVALVLVVGGIVAYALTRGPSGGLRPILLEGGLGYEGRCGQTVGWPAAIVGNTSDTSLVLDSVRVKDLPPGWSVAYARAWHGHRDFIGDIPRRDVPLRGVSIAPHTGPPPALVWHIIVGIRTPRCAAPPVRFWKGNKSLLVSYTIGGGHRTARLGEQIGICAAAIHVRCPRDWFS